MNGKDLAERDADFVRELHEELAYARRKFPSQARDILFKALVEEVGEVSRAMLEKWSPTLIRGELVQVAAVAARLAAECEFEAPAGESVA
jgi:hypothetical protein